MFHATPTPLDRAEEALQQLAAAWCAQSATSEAGAA